MDQERKLFIESDERIVSKSHQLLSKYRTAIIEDFIKIEWYATAIICKHYIGYINNNFMREVLSDDLCSTALKANLLEKALNRNKEIKKPRIYADKFRQLSKYRNYFAHCNSIFADDGFLDSPNGVPNSKKQDEFLDIEKIINDFFSIHKELSTFLLDIMMKMEIIFAQNTKTGDVIIVCEDLNQNK
ncbi:MAG: hypothetical protein ACYDBT_04115 [Desulfobulbaceae bacterium]